MILRRKDVEGMQLARTRDEGPRRGPVNAKKEFRQRVGSARHKENSVRQRTRHFVDLDALWLKVVA